MSSNRVLSRRKRKAAGPAILPFPGPKGPEAIDAAVLAAIEAILSEGAYPSCKKVARRTGHALDTCSRARTRLESKGLLPFKPRLIRPGTGTLFTSRNRDQLEERIAAVRAVKEMRLGRGLSGVLSMRELRVALP